ncbi:MAG: hypothetical protein FJ027_14590 [Candidatus Rokubacteria bacterium]|nr:hypothetical protein [Candidatus Rokubacteria bacterium]
MGLDWPGLVRKYVWDEERTPYLVASAHLTPRQIRSELFAYAFLLAMLAALATVAAMARGRGDAVALVGMVYAASVLVAAVSLGVTGRPAPALYCVTAPLAAVAAAALRVVRADMQGTEWVMFVAFAVLWIGYSVRIVRIARRLHPGE